MIVYGFNGIAEATYQRLAAFNRHIEGFLAETYNFRIAERGRPLIVGGYGYNPLSGYYVIRRQQRNVVLHPEFVNGKYALYTRPQDGFIDTGNGGGIGWALVDDICHAEVHDEVIINKREYHTIKEVKNGEGPHPIKTEKGWLHLAHGVRCCAAGLRYVLYLYMTSLEDPTKMIAEPAGYFMAPVDEERIGDVSNVLFSNGWIADEDGKVYIYYASSDTRMHVAESTVDRLVDYCLHTPADGLRSIESVRTIIAMVDHNKKILK